jgi:acetyl esterase/lipase
MYLKVWAVRRYIRKGDLERNGKIPEPTGLKCYRNLSYTFGLGKGHLLDVYRPENAVGPLPTLVVVHGGGWYYGDKEIYHLYAKDLARRGFAVICFNYILTPRKKFPYPLTALDNVLLWAKNNASKYGFDLNNVFLVGDSAGANIAVQYAAAETNPDYAKFFKLAFPLKIKGLGLNCGTYCRLGTPYKEESENFIWPLYLGKHFDLQDPRYDVVGAIRPGFPACYILTGEKDFIKDQNPILTVALDKEKVPYIFKEYHSKEGNKLQHVFHCTVNEENAIKANDNECAYFRTLMK